MLSSEGDNDEDDATKEVCNCHQYKTSVRAPPLTSFFLNRQKVTISTCHAAKGLEWPVVMVPGGTYSPRFGVL